MTKSVSQYITRLQPAFDSIEKAVNDAGSVHLTNLAQACFISPYHFHRIYRLLTGETCQQTLSRLRLAVASHAMKDKSLSITEVAHLSGFSSSQAFAKALKNKTGTNARDLRADDNRLARTLELLSVPEPVPNETPAVSIELTQLSPMKIIAIETTGTYPALNSVYHTLFDVAGDPAAVKAILGMPGPDSANLDDGENRFICGLLLREGTVPTPKQTASCQTIEPGHYARVRHLGSFDHLELTLDALYLTIMESSDWSFGTAPCVFHYLDDPEDTVEAQLRTDLYVPVQSKEM